MRVKLKRLEHGYGLPVPAKATNGASGFDLASADDGEIGPGQWRIFRTGFAIELPDGYEAQIRPRSGLAKNHGISVLNSPGTIDSDYRGEVAVLLVNHSLVESVTISRGDRIAQLVIAPVVTVDLELVGDLAATVRGDGGFGSTGGFLDVKKPSAKFKGIRRE